MKDFKLIEAHTPDWSTDCVILTDGEGRAKVIANDVSNNEVIEIAQLFSKQVGELESRVGDDWRPKSEVFGNLYWSEIPSIPPIFDTGREEGDSDENGRYIYWVSLCDTKNIIEYLDANVHTDCCGDLSTHGSPHPDYTNYYSIENYVDRINEKLYSEKELKEIQSLFDAIKVNYDEDGGELIDKDFLQDSKEIERLSELLDCQDCYETHAELIRQAKEQLGIKPEQIVIGVESWQTNDGKYRHPNAEEYLKAYSQERTEKRKNTKERE